MFDAGRTAEAIARTGRRSADCSGAADELVARGSLAAGDHHMCALRDTGRVACWGKGGTQLGVPGSADQLVPVDVPGVEHAAGVAAARDLTCAWTAIGEAWCWGGEPSNRQTDHAPRRVPGLHDIVQVVAGFGGACGLRANGRVACWQADAWQDPLYPGPTEVAGIANAIEIAGDDEHLCARTKRDVLCTAISDLRHPSIDNQHVIAIAEAASATSLAGYNEQFAALLPGGKLASWDMAVIEDRVSPAPDQKVVVAALPAAAGSAERLYAGGAVNSPIRFCAVGGGAGTCWNAGTTFDGARALEAGVQDVAIGEETTCVRVADRARCRGMIGRRGDGGAELPAAPVRVQGISDARQLEASIMDRTCVVRATGRVACWGARWASVRRQPVVDQRTARAARRRRCRRDRDVGRRRVRAAQARRGVLDDRHRWQHPPRRRARARDGRAAVFGRRDLRRRRERRVNCRTSSRWRCIRRTARRSSRPRSRSTCRFA